MTQFIQRTSAPSANDEFYGTKNPFANTYYSMFKRHPLFLGNCTHYCYGRMSEVMKKKCNLPTCNAENWYDRTNFPKSKVPKVASVVVWKHKNKSGGHVGFIEEIKSNGDLVVSMSGWNSFLFKTRVVTKASGYVYSDYELVGFIHCPIEFDTPKVDAPKNTTGSKPTICQSNANKYKSYVKEIQKILRNKGYVNVRNGVKTNTLISADGIWGNNTEQAVRRFQANNKLVADGIVGVNTWKALTR